MVDHPIGVGDEVFIRNRGFTGRHKLQDLWSTTRYRVQTAKDSVYTVVSDTGQQRTLNRRDMKRVPPKYISSDNYPARDPYLFVGVCDYAINRRVCGIKNHRL